jgi:hypothetical protein
VPDFSSLRRATFQTEGGTTLLKVWTHGVTPEGSSVALSGTLSVRQGDNTRSFDLGSSDGQVVLPVVPGA